MGPRGRGILFRCWIGRISTPRLASTIFNTWTHSSPGISNGTSMSSIRLDEHLSGRPLNRPSPILIGPGQCAPPANLQNWDDYVTAIVTHVGSRITYWELWNEPQDPEYYCGDMRTMVTMAQHAYRIIKAINPAAQIITPAASAAGGPAWLDSYLSQGEGSTPTSCPFTVTAITRRSRLTP